MKEVIRSHLKQIEADETVRIVYACESGSRAWGFPSTDSDYDVRFLYVRPAEWYLSLDEKRDVLERPIDGSLDIVGWDLKKALRLFRKSNPPLFEWLGSPIVYAEEPSVTARIRALIPIYYSPTACFHHYLHMARGNYREYLKGEEVWLKKYFYVLRPLLAMRWVEEGRGLVPTEFGVLVEKLALDPELRGAIDGLLAAKSAGVELSRGPRIEPISAFIARELERWEKHPIVKRTRPAEDGRLDELFRECLAEVWQS